MRSNFRIVVAVAAAALAAPALASDPTQPDVTNPSAAIALHGSGRAEAEALNADPTWPHSEYAAPAMTSHSLGGEAIAGTILNDEPMASAVHEPSPARLVSK